MLESIQLNEKMTKRMSKAFHLRLPLFNTLKINLCQGQMLYLFLKSRIFFYVLHSFRSLNISKMHNSARES